MTLNKLPISPRSHKRATRRGDSSARSGLRAASAAARCPIPSASSQSPWLDQPASTAHAGLRRLGQRLEIDMGGQILLARVGQRIGEGVAAHRLQRVARRADRHGHNR